MGTLRVTPFGNEWVSLLRFDPGDIVRMGTSDSCPAGGMGRPSWRLWKAGTKASRAAQRAGLSLRASWTACSLPRPRWSPTNSSRTGRVATSSRRFWRWGGERGTGPAPGCTPRPLRQGSDYPGGGLPGPGAGGLGEIPPRQRTAARPVWEPGALMRGMVAIHLLAGNPGHGPRRSDGVLLHAVRSIGRARPTIAYVGCASGESAPLPALHLQESRGGGMRACREREPWWQMARPLHGEVMSR